MICTKLFKPGKIGSMELKNRVILPAMGSEMTVNGGEPSDKLIDYHVARVKGGCGLNIVEIAAIHPTTKNPMDLGIYDDSFIPGLKRIADAIREAGGKSAIQIWHGGRVVRKPMEGYDIVAPSPIKSLYSANTPRELTISEIYELIEAYGDACLRAKKAGFDSIELHGAHGYLLAEFMSKTCNKRNDEFGGSFDNRMKFPLMVIKNVRKKVGTDFPIIYRISSSEFCEDGLTVEDVIEFAKLAEKAGIDALHVSAGTTQTLEYVVPPIDFKQGFNIDNASKIKAHINVPVIAVGRINDPILAEKILDDDKADFIAIGRAQLADAEFCNKARENRFDEIVRCVGCNQGCFDMYLVPNQDISCLRNPACSKEKEYEITSCKNPKKVLVIGGGPGGVEASKILKLRGHNVTLCEKTNSLGGQFKIAGLAPRKEEFAHAADNMEVELRKIGVKILKLTEVNEKFIKKFNPDEVVIATGANQLIPSIPGINNTNVKLAWDVLKGESSVGQNVVVIGGGLVGLEVAETLAEEDKNVTVVEMMERVGNGIGWLRGICVDKSIYKLGVKTLTNTKCLEIKEDSVLVESNETAKQIENIDSVVIAIGSRPNNYLVDVVKEMNIPCHIVGDAVKPRRALDAIWEAAEIARKI
ncbi:MAG: FAD-dependent oxidoreductase [Peptostreptococcaceae bacterium]